MKKLSLIIGITIISLSSISCSSKKEKENKPLPSLCECLTASDTNFRTSKECREVYINVYGTSYPNAQQTTRDYFDCGGN